MLREAPWCRVEIGQWQVGAGTQQGAGSAAAQDHGVAGLRGGGGTRVWGGAGVEDGGAGGPRGPIKGWAGILGRRAQGKSRRGSRPGIPLREWGIREEEDRADRWARERSERGGARAGALGVREWLAGPSASGGSGIEWVERGRHWAEKGVGQ